MTELFVNEKDDKVIENKNLENSMYIDFKPFTKGQLYAPEVIKVKNFSGQDILNLSMCTKERLLKETIDSVNRCIVGIDAGDLHEEEFIQLLLFIQANYWNKIIPEIPYNIDKSDIEYLKEHNPERLKSIKEDKENLSFNIKIQDIKFKPLDKNVKPIYTLKHNGHSLKLRFISIKDMLFMETNITDKFKDLEEQKKKIIKSKEEESRDYMDEEINFINDYVTKRAKDIVNYLRACALLSYDDIEFDNFESRLEFIESDNIDSVFWNKYELFNKKFSFGHSIDPVKIKSPITGKKVERRLSFRLDQILSALHVQDLNEDDFTFD